MRRILLICGIIMGIAIICIGAYKIAMGSLDGNFSEIGKSVKVTEVTATEKIANPDEASNVIAEATNMAHAMSNTLIEADHIWDTVPMNKVNVDKLLVLINRIGDGEEKTTLLAIAQKWEKSDFTKVDEDHNTVWSMLDGTTGKATGIKKDEAAIAVLNMK